MCRITEGVRLALAGRWVKPRARAVRIARLITGLEQSLRMHAAKRRCRRIAVAVQHRREFAEMFAMPLAAILSMRRRSR